MTQNGLPPKQGLYDPQFEHDACGVGFVVQMKGKPSHEIVVQGLTILKNLEHRGAVGAEANSGDGAGVLMQVPDAFLRRACAAQGFDLPAAGHYGVGMVFLPMDEAERTRCEALIAETVAAEGQTLLGWRTVPTDDSTLGETAREVEPLVRQFFVGRGAAISDVLGFERKLYVIRNSVSHAVAKMTLGQGDRFYILSLSARTIIYKGMLTTAQLEEFYPDLSEPDLASALALVHSRFSTNTFPSWKRAHPYRFVAHNGEINTLRGNVNWMHARQALAASPAFGDDIKKLLPVIDTDGSDSAMFDNCLEFLTLGGRSLPHAIMMMIPEPWANHESMSDAQKAFYEYHSCLMEPWDGPASIAFTDGELMGAVLDRNGLRPSRYYVTKDDLVVMASEVGVLDIAPENVLVKGRLQPGRMFLVDTREGRIVADEEIKERIVTEHPYRQWLNDNLLKLEELPEADHLPIPDHDTVLQRQLAFGYTFEDLRILMAPMAKQGIEAMGSMGTDTPLAVLSDRPQPLYNYFQQLFAQVTNPPIDAIREEIVTSAITTLGTEGNVLEARPESCHLIELKSPILTNEELAKFRYIGQEGFKSVTLPMLFRADGGEAAVAQAMEEIYTQADQAIQNGNNILILSDRGVDKEMAPIPALLACAGLHHHLIREGTRTKVGLILETGEPREVHHFSLLIGYGAGAINPYLAFETLDDMIRQNLLTDIDHKTACKNFVKAASKGVVKVTSKMGISTIHSYCGAQIFEAVGLSSSVVDRYFTWTPTRIEGAGLDVIAREATMRHQRAFPDRSVEAHTLDVGGQYQWRSDGEVHLFSPKAVHALQRAVRENDPAAFKEYSGLVNNQLEERCTLRGLLDFKARAPIPIDEVESWESIVRRFKTGAMSYGSISIEAHEALAIAMNRIGGKSNTGEGGEAPSRYVVDANGDSRNSAIKQVASGRFGVTSQYLVNAREIQIKMAQGAKPGEGGQLPGPKVYPPIAKVRYSTPGVGLISPPPHHDIYSIEDLAELIHDLKNANTQARISVKLVAEVGVGTIAAGVAKAKADVVLISGHDGGTGASPQTSIKHAGIPWELGLAETHQTLLLNDLRSRIVVETDGQLKTGRDVVIAALLGAEEFGFATAPLVSLGCIMMRVCHLNTCPVGVATQNPLLRKNFTGDPAHAVNFMRFVASEVREIMASLGFRTLEEMVGRTDVLESTRASEHWKTQGLDLSAMLYQPDVPEATGRHQTETQDHGLANALDVTTLLPLCAPALEGGGERVEATLPIRNVNRVTGTILGSEVTRRHGVGGLPEDTIQLTFQGSAGQSFGAFLPPGVTLRLEGDANDYVGKGLSGGKLIVFPPAASTFVAEDNIIIGNTALYGATGGEVYLRGVAGERFAVRNSGALAVVEGVGDHGCEYMTGGRVVVLGQTGRNFAAGMSGGIAYVLDTDGDFARRCNGQMVDLDPLDDLAEQEELRQIVRRHAEYTGSRRAESLLADWSGSVTRFVKVLPRDYKRMLEAIRRVEASGLSGEAALQAAFEENAKDVSRVGGG